MIPLWRIFLDVFLPHLIRHAECVDEFEVFDLGGFHGF